MGQIKKLHLKRFNEKCRTSDNTGDVNKEYPPDRLAGGYFYRLLDTLNSDNPCYVNLT